MITHCRDKRTGKCYRFFNIPLHEINYPFEWISEETYKQSPEYLEDEKAALNSYISMAIKEPAPADAGEKPEGAT